MEKESMSKTINFCCALNGLNNADECANYEEDYGKFCKHQGFLRIGKKYQFDICKFKNKKR